MSRSRSKQGAALLALLAPLAFGGCVDDSVSLRVTCSLRPESDCTYSVTGMCNLGGRLNLQVPQSYGAVLRVSNGLKPRNSEIPPKSEPNGLQVTELEIELSDSTGQRIDFGPNVANPFTVPATGFIEPGEDGMVGADLIPFAYVNRIRTLLASNPALGQVRLAVIVRAKTSGRVDVESAPWNWTVAVGAVDTSAAGRACVQVEDEVCRFGQDEAANACDPAEMTEEL